MIYSASATSQWPSYYAAKFTPGRSMGYRASAAITWLVWTDRPSRALAAGTLSAGAVIFAIVGVMVPFQQDYLLISLTPLGILLLGAAYSVLGNLRLQDIYRYGSESRIVLKDGQLMMRLNGHYFSHPVTDVRRLRRFGTLTAIEYDGHQFTIIPTNLVPHYTSR